MKSTVNHTYIFSLSSIEFSDVIDTENLLSTMLEDMEDRHIDELVKPTTGEALTTDMLKQAIGVLNSVRYGDDETWNAC